jgi:hypothetical protein
MKAHQLWVVVLLILALGVAHGSTFVDKSSDQALIGPSAPQFAHTLQALQAADYADRMNATSWSADNPTIDRFYARKAASVEALIHRLKGGGSVSSVEVARALDNSRALRLGGW